MRFGALALGLDKAVAAASFILAVQFVFVPPAFCTDDGIDRMAVSLESRWVNAEYVLLDKSERLQAAESLERDAAQLAEKLKSNAAPLIWQAKALMMRAELHHNYSSLGMIRKARDLLEKAAKIDTDALGGIIHTSLGQIYDQVPGWPIGFGDNDKAFKHLTKALSIDANGIDANFCYGEYLLRHGRRSKAMSYLEKAINMPPRPDHIGLDEGRKTEAEKMLTEAQAAG